jgi:hypothetical protein
MYKKRGGRLAASCAAYTKTGEKNEYSPDE